MVYHHHVSTVADYARRKFRIGYWKVLVHTRHPDKLLRDSHTPQILKLQILLIPLLVIGAALSLLWPSWWWFPVSAAVLLLASMIPFCLRAWRANPAVALVAPGLLLVRAVSLGTGLAAGITFQVGRLFSRSGPLEL